MARPALRSHFLLLFVAVACLFPLQARAVPSTAVQVDDLQGGLVLNGRLDWWPDAPAATTIREARAADAPFVPAPARASFGWRPHPLWFRVALANPGSVPRNLLVEEPFANIDELDLAVVRGDAVAEHWETGFTRGNDARPLSSPRFLFPVRLAAGETATLYLRVASGTVVNLPLRVYDERAYFGHVGGTRGWQGLFYGLVLGTLLCAAFLWRTTGDRTFRHYTLAVLLAIGYFLGMDGYVVFWFPAYPAAQQKLLFFGACLSVTFTLQFARAFLDTAQRSPRIDRVLRDIAWAAVGATALSLLFPPLLAMALAMLFSIAMAVSMLVAGLAVLRAGFRPARLLVLAMMVHLVTISLLSFSALAEVPGLFEFADNLHRAGFVFLLVCFTLALGQRIRVLDEDRRRAEEAVLQSRADSRARGEFLSRMSHELRTPMTGVLGMAELLDHTALDTRQRRYLSTLRYSGEILLNLINDVLDHARLEAGRLQVRREAFDLLRLVDECRQLFEQQPRDDGSVLRIDIGAGASRVLVGDGPRIRQVLVNVLMRAFRVAGGGDVELRVQSLDGPGWLRFEVAGTGRQAGVDEKAGEALETSRRLCELMGGRLAVQAVQGAGTLYRIDLPLYAAT